MKINHLVQGSEYKKQNTQPSFKGTADAGLRYLATNLGIGANMTDIGFMVFPRVLSDAQRGPAACIETTRREASGTLNHSSIGLYGWLAGAGIASMMGLKEKFGVNANAMFTAPETLNILAENKVNQIKNNQTQQEYLKNIFNNIKAYNPSASNSNKNKDGFIKLSDQVIDDITLIMDKAINNKDLNFKKWSNSKTANSLNVISNKIIADTGAESKYILESTNKNIKSETTLKTLLEDVYKVSKSFNNDKVINTFKEQIKNNKEITNNAYIKKMSRFMKARSIASFATASALGMAVQPINIYLTKKKTGSDGFVGVEGRSKDNSLEFKAIKGASAFAFMGIVLVTLQTGLKGFMNKMAIKGFWPTISQLKGIYGLTIISRILATRDKDELREALTKDILGFLSWLVLGDFVNKATAAISDTSVMNYKKGTENSNFLKKVFHSSLKTRDEIIIDTLSKNGISINKGNKEELYAKSFKDLLGEVKNLSPEIKKQTQNRLKTLNKAQCAGYMFSGLVLGFGIPNLNIYITNTLEKKRKAKLAEQQNNTNTTKA